MVVAGRGPGRRRLAISSAVADDDGLVVGSVHWAPNVPWSQKTDWDKTNYWAHRCLAVDRQVCRQLRVDGRRQCDSPGTREVQRPHWCRGALLQRLVRPGVGQARSRENIGWGIGWGADRATAEQHALQGARDHNLPEAKVVYSINSAQLQGGAIAFSELNRQVGLSTGGAGAPLQSPAILTAPDAKVIGYQFDCWMALAMGDDQSAYGWGYAGNLADAESNALEECAKRTKNGKIVLSFCSNGVEY